MHRTKSGNFKTRTTALVLALLMVTCLGAVGAASAETITFVDWSWDSAQVHNRIAGLIVQHGYGYDVEYMFADTVPGFQGIVRGDIDVSMEMWTDNIYEIWIEATEKGQMLDLGSNFPDAPQGWYVPTYMIEGDPDRGIKPVAPDLRSVEDLKKYWKLFRDPEQPSKGRFYTAPTGWVAHDINAAKIEAYGLDENYTAFAPGSQAALASSIMSAYRRGKPWVGYYWEPTDIMGKLDMTLLEEPEYDEQIWNDNYGCEYPAAQVRKAVTASLVERAPEVVEFLKNYETTLAQTNASLAYLSDTGTGDTEAAARWFLTEYEAVWSSWVPESVAAKVKAAL